VSTRCFGLGLGEPIAFSAEHGEGLSETLRTRLSKSCPPRGGASTRTRRARAEPACSLGEEEDGSELDLAKSPLRIAVLGRPNAGKSTLINHYPWPGSPADRPRARPSTPRLDLASTPNGTDASSGSSTTAGLAAEVADRREGGKAPPVADGAGALWRFAEKSWCFFARRTIPFEKQDLTLADLLEKEGRALVNRPQNKWNLVDNKSDKGSPSLREEADRSCRSCAGTARDIPFPA